MKHLILGLAILLPAMASADVTLKPNVNSYGHVQDAVLSGEDAKAMRAVIGKKSHHKKTIRGIQAIRCVEDKCTISFNGEIASNPEQARDLTRESEDLNTFSKTFTPSENEKLVSIPSGNWYYHGRDEVLSSDKALYRFLSSKKNALHGELDGDKTVSVEGENFKLSCLKRSRPEVFEMAKCIPHGGCLPAVFSKYILITHQCRSYLKATK